MNAAEFKKLVQNMYSELQDVKQDVREIKKYLKNNPAQNNTNDEKSNTGDPIQKKEKEPENVEDIIDDTGDTFGGTLIEDDE